MGIRKRLVLVTFLLGIFTVYSDIKEGVVYVCVILHYGRFTVRSYHS